MHGGASNSDYHRTRLPQTPYGHLPARRPPFSDTFNTAPFPPPYRGPLGPPSFQSPLPGHSPAGLLQAHPYRPPGPCTDGFGGAPNRDPFYEVAQPKPFQHSQPAQGWTAQQTDLQSLEVRKKAEEFLRILEAQDRLELSSEKCSRREDVEIGDAGSSTRSKSRARSRARSKSRHRSRSRGKSRGRSRARSRSRSRSRGKSRPRAKSRAHSRSRSRSHGKTVVRSKSQPRLDTRKDSQWSARDCSHSAGASVRMNPLASTAPDVFQDLKHILQSKELEKHLSVVKSALIRNQILDEVRVKQESQPAAGNFQKLPELQHKLWKPESPSDFGQSALLPHELVGGGTSSFPRILSWDDPSQKPELKPMFPNIEDEEEFLYGEEERTKPQAVTVPLAQSRPVRSPVETLLSVAESPHLSKTVPLQGAGLLQDLQVQSAPSRQLLAPDTAKVTAEEREKVRNLLKTIGLNLGTADISKMAARLKQKQAEQREAPPSQGLAILRPALEALQALTKAPKSEDSRSNRSGSSHSHRDSDRKEKSDEKERREKQIQMKRKEYLVKELEGLLKQEGSGDLIPVIGFFCQRCEEFFGDLSSAEGHSACHRQKKSTEEQPKQHKDSRRSRDSQQGQELEPREMERAVESRSLREHDERSPDRKRPKDERSSPSSSVRAADGKDAGENKGCGKKPEDEESAKSEKRKKKKKEKKMKKKEKKKKKKGKTGKGVVE